MEAPRTEFDPQLAIAPKRMPDRQRVCTRELSYEELHDLLVVASAEIMKLQCEIGRLRNLSGVTEGEIFRRNVVNKYVERMALSKAHYKMDRKVEASRKRRLG